MRMLQHPWVVLCKAQIHCLIILHDIYITFHQLRGSTLISISFCWQTNFKVKTIMLKASFPV